MMLGIRQHVLGNRRGFTLVELLVVIVVLAVITAIVLPKFVGTSARGRQSAQRNDIRLLEDAVGRFYADTRVYPATLADLAATRAPATGKNASNCDQTINPADWHGPYIESVPTDPVTGRPFTYTPSSGRVSSVSSTTPTEVAN